jgi:hypothetical protein
MNEKKSLGDIVVTSGAFYERHGVIVKVTDVKWKGNVHTIRCEDIDGNGYVGSHGDFFWPSQWKHDIDTEHPWLSEEQSTKCCDKYDSKYCPECGSKL